MGLENFGIAGGPAKKSSKSAKKSSKTKATPKNEEDIDLESVNSEEISNESPTESSEGGTSSLSMASKKKKLRCTKPKCGYTRTLFKRELEPNDYICTKCGGEMKLTK